MAGFSPSKGKYITAMDDDLHHSLEDTLILVKIIQNSREDITIGNFKKKQHTVFKQILSKWIYNLENAILKRKEKIYFSYFLIIKKGIVEEILQYKEPYLFINGIIIRTADSYENVFVSHSKRKYGKSSSNMIILISFLLNSFTNFSIIPLRIATFSNYIFSIIPFIITLYYIFIIVKSANYVLQTWLSAIIFIGIIGECIGRISLHINNSQQFVLKY